jgi:hypothetical protein
MPCGYGGRLLAVAASACGRRVAAAGEPAACELPRPRPAAPAAAAARIASGGERGEAQGAALAAAAAAAGAAGRRRRGPKGAAVALDALAGGDALGQLSLGEGGGDAGGGGGEHARRQQQQQQHHGPSEPQLQPLRAPVFVLERAAQ